MDFGRRPRRLAPCLLVAAVSMSCAHVEGTVPEDYRAVAVTVDSMSACALRADGSMFCWGMCLGTAPAQSPCITPPPPNERFLAIEASGWEVTCGIRASDRSIACYPATSTPPRGAFKAVRATVHDLCGLRDDGTVACSRFDDSEPPLTLDGRYVEIAMSDYDVCGLRDDGTVRCGAPERIGLVGDQFVHLAGMWGGMCGLRADQTVECAGAPGGFAQRSLTVGVDHARRFFVAGDGRSGCWLREDATIGCFGELNAPAGHFRDLGVERASSSATACAVDTEGTLVCWGLDRFHYGVLTPPT